MYLTPREKDKLLISLAAMVARSRLDRGVRLNHPEAIADMIKDVQVEATFPDGTKLVTVHYPIRKEKK